MDNPLGRIEHTALGPLTTWADVTGVLDEAIRHGLRACVPPCYVEPATDYAPGVDISTVVGFPHGQHAVATKCAEAERAWEDGAAELDVVANFGLLAEDTERLERELTEVVAAVPVPVKVITEAPLLAEDELRQVCEAAVAADAAFLKTATGFSGGGATVADVELLGEYLPVKASGGIGSRESADVMFEAGAARIGTSSGDVLAREYEATGE